MADRKQPAEDPNAMIIATDVDADGRVSQREEERRREQEEQRIINDVIAILQAKDKFPSRQRDVKIADLAFEFLIELNGTGFFFLFHALYSLCSRVGSQKKAKDPEQQRRRMEKKRRARRFYHQAVVNKLSTVLQRSKKMNFFSTGTKKYRKIVDLGRKFLIGLENDIRYMIIDQWLIGDRHRGLDSERDTEAEIETALRFFPQILTTRGGRNGFLPIQCITGIYKDFWNINNNRWICNVKTVSFVYLFARLAIEFNSFEEQERGGLLTENGDVLRRLMKNTGPSNDEEHFIQPQDTTLLRLLIRLRETDLLRKEDINRYQLIHYLCWQNYFFDRRFRFLVEWNPSSLLHSDASGWLPLHYVACYSSIQAFRTVFEFCIRYYPCKVGFNLLFRNGHHPDVIWDQSFVPKNNENQTPIQIACGRFKRKNVMRIVEEVLGENLDETKILEALILAATDANVRFDCVYFLLRRRPDMLK